MSQVVEQGANQHRERPSTELSEGRDARSLLQRRVVLGDGAMATMLHHAGVPVRTCYEELSLTHPQLVRDVHIAYIRAGADVIQTNTFSGHRLGLRRYGVEEKVVDINRAAVAVARAAVAAERSPRAANAAADRPVYVFGTIGSALDIGGAKLVAESGWGALRQVFAEQLDVLLAAGVDGLVLETFADLEEMALAITTVRAATDLPIVATLSPDAADVTRDSVPIAQAFAQMKRLGADVVGLNCHLGLAGISRAYERIAMDSTTVYAAVPNAGLLHMTDGEYGYTAGADYFADMGAKLVAQGVRWIGGCCGSTPDHIRKLAARIAGADVAGEVPQQRAVRAEPSSAAGVDAASHRVATGAAPVSARGSAAGFVDAVARGAAKAPHAPSHLLDKVRERTTIIVELDPPRTPNLARYMQGAQALHAAGVDAITLADNSLGTVRVSNMAVAALLKPLCIEPLVHVACRDRNLIGQQSHLMGLNVLGIHHILLVTGDPSRFGDLPGATSVYDVSSIELTKMVRRLNEGIAFSGRPVKQPARFVVGTSFNPNVRNFDKAIERLKRKLEAGADYVMTQPVYDVRMMEAIANATEAFGVPVFIGMMPLVSARNALYLHNEVPGIQVPDYVLQRIVDAPEASATEVGMEMMAGLLAEARQFFRGIYLMTPFLRYDLSVRLTQYLRELGD